jgi:signal transduction histidine kinase
MGMIRWAYAPFGALVAVVLILGGLADRALVEQARAAQEAALSEAEDNARLTARSVSAALAEAEKAVLTGEPWSGVSAGRLVDPYPMSAPGDSFVPYLERSKDELMTLLSAEGLTPSVLPRAVVAAVALGSPEAKAQVADRLLSGRIPVRREDLDYLARALGAEKDPRLDWLHDRFRHPPQTASLPVLPSFRRSLTDRAAIEGWSRGEGELRCYEIPLDVLLSRAGVSERASLADDTSVLFGGTGKTRVSIPEVDGLTLIVDLDVPGRLRIQALRWLLWVAILASVLGFTAVIRAVRREAKAVSREKTFLTSVTHELRTPLAAIHLFGETLAEGRGDPREYGALVAQESERLDALVERVIAASRVDERLSFTRLEPGTLVQSAVDLIAARAEKRSIQVVLETSLKGGVLPEVMWDADAVRRALLNLLDNAIKHGRHGGRVEVKATVEDELVKLTVSDDGPGIGPRDRKRVFGRFQRGPTETAGTGLGLYVVEQVARAHGGRVDLVTEENRGAAFTLVLPLVPPEAATGKSRRVEPA